MAGTRDTDWGAVRIYSYPSSASDHIAANILEDFKFTDKYIKTNNRRLAETYQYAVGFLREHGIPYYPAANAGFFLWVDLRKSSRHATAPQSLSEKLDGLGMGGDGPKKQGNVTGDDNEAIMANLLKHKVFLNSWVQFGGENEGWFRVVFSQDRPYLTEGLKRMVEATS